MKHEHKLMDSALSEMRTLTCNFTPPDDASDDLTTLYEGLIRLEADFQAHTHLENNVLWPMQAAKQKPADTTITTDKLTSTGHEEDTTCPKTNLPCENGSPMGCKIFWECVSGAMHQRWNKTNRKG